MTDTDWITDRLPTDADANGDVLARWPDAENPAMTWISPTEWEVVAVTTGISWRHTSMWRSPDGATPTIRAALERLRELENGND